MSFINYNTWEINCKIVYYGPGLGGKTTNIQHIYKKTARGNKGDIININSENERTLFFDFLPLSLGKIRGFKTRFHLYTVPGQVFYEASRKLILRGVDGIIFVADSQIDKLEANLKSLESLENNLMEQGYDIFKIPMVMQWNKRDLPNIISEKNMHKQINKWNVPTCSSTAINGVGVFETLKIVSKLILMNLKGGLSKQSQIIKKNEMGL